jgi:hypothetical protein
MALKAMSRPEAAELATKPTARRSTSSHLPVRAEDRLALALSECGRAPGGRLRQEGFGPALKREEQGGQELLVQLRQKQELGGSGLETLH